MLRKRGGEKYNFILRGGPSLHAALFKLFQVVWDEERKPDSWCNTLVIPIPKGKGKKNDMNSKRLIHTKTQIPKFFQHIVTAAVKPTIVENISPFQIGAVPGHRAQEHLFTVKSFITMVEKKEEAVGIQIFDLKKYFDKEFLQDGLNELYKG